MILITGASGLLGSCICKHFIDKGHQVVAIKRSTSDIGLLHEYNDRIQWKNADLQDTSELITLLKGIETVVHCAAMVSFKVSEKDQMYAVNVMGTANIVNASLIAGVQNFIHISSVGAIGRHTNKPLINEDQKWEDSELHTEYGHTKYLAELEVFRGQAEGLNTIILNPSIVLAPAKWHRSSARLFQTVHNGQKFYTDGSINFVDGRDVAAIALTLLEKEFFGERFILNAGNVPNKEFLSKIADNFAKQRPTINAGFWLLRIGWLFENLRSLFSGKQPLITKETMKVARATVAFDNTKISTLIHYEFRTLDESLGWVCQEIEMVNGLK